jgi:hypothetical protein
MKLKYALLFSFGLVIMFLFVSCQSGTEPTMETTRAGTVTSTPVYQSSLELTTISLPPTAAVMVKTTSTPVLGSTVSATIVSETIKPSPTLVESTIIPSTLTPLPTFTANELETAVAELLANSMNCGDVPCWWGAVPDETTVFEIQQFLARYKFEDYYRRDNDHNQIPDYIELWFNEGQFDFRVMYSFQNSILQTVFSEQSPSLYEILKKYGEPDEVWLSTVSFVRDGNLSVRLNLVYLQAGMAVGYVVNGNLQNNIVTGCFFDQVGLLSLGVPDSATSYKDFPAIFETDRRYLPLEEATGLTMDDFLQRFSDSTQPQCIETPAELWN